MQIRYEISNNCGRERIDCTPAVLKLYDQSTLSRYSGFYACIVYGYSRNQWMVATESIWVNLSHELVLCGYCLCILDNLTCGKTWFGCPQQAKCICRSSCIFHRLL